MDGYDQDPTENSTEDGGVAGRPGDLRLPDQHRLELDEALDGVDELDLQVRGAQGRLRALIRANATVTKDLQLPTVLHAIVEAARQLCDSRYAALGVLGRGEVFEQFVHAGVDEATAARIGGHPQGVGLLGRLIRHPGPIRVNDLALHDAASGFPADHPQMRTFLGVPILVSGQVYGNLYVTERTSGSFTTEDEELLLALAATAGVAIQNARLFARSESQRSWLQAAAMVNQKILRRDAGSLAVVLEEAARATEADAASVVTELSGGGWTWRAGAGQAVRFHPALAGDLQSTITGQAIRSGEVVRVADIGVAAVHDSRSTVSGPGLAVPLKDADAKVFGCLTVVRDERRPEFTEDDAEQLSEFAHHVAVAIELDHALDAREAMRIATERARIAADLHDHVIQDLFATGLGLQAAAMLISTPVPRERVLEAIDTLDATIKEIRGAIFRLQAESDRIPSVRERIVESVRLHEPALGFSATIEISGVLAAPDPELTDDVIAVVDEALDNIAEHANACAATVQLTLDEARLVVTVSDDGDGMGDGAPHGGLARIRDRAKARSGGLDVDTGPEGGARITWTVPHPALRRLSRGSTVGRLRSEIAADGASVE